MSSETVSISDALFELPTGTWQECEVTLVEPSSGLRSKPMPPDPSDLGLSAAAMTEIEDEDAKARKAEDRASWVKTSAECVLFIVPIGRLFLGAADLIDSVLLFLCLVVIVAFHPEKLFRPKSNPVRANYLKHQERLRQYHRDLAAFEAVAERESLFFGPVFVRSNLSLKWRVCFGDSDTMFKRVEVQEMKEWTFSRSSQ